MVVVQTKDRLVIRGACSFYSQDKYKIDLTDERLFISVRDGDLDKQFLVRINKKDARKVVKMLQEFYETEE